MQIKKRKKSLYFIDKFVIRIFVQFFVWHMAANWFHNPLYQWNNKKSSNDNIKSLVNFRFNVFPKVLTVVFKGFLFFISFVAFAKVWTIGGFKCIITKMIFRSAKDFWGSCYNKKYRECGKDYCKNGLRNCP